MGIHSSLGRRFKTRSASIGSAICVSSRQCLDNVDSELSANSYAQIIKVTPPYGAELLYILWHLFTLTSCKLFHHQFPCNALAAGADGIEIQAGFEIFDIHYRFAACNGDFSADFP